MAKGSDTGESVRVSRELSVKELLDMQPKRHVRIAQAPKGEQQLSDVVVGVNGYNFQIKRGFDVEVPETVYKILAESSYI